MCMVPARAVARPPLGHPGHQAVEPQHVLVDVPVRKTSTIKSIYRLTQHVSALGRNLNQPYLGLGPAGSPCKANDLRSSNTEMIRRLTRTRFCRHQNEILSQYVNKSWDLTRQHSLYDK